MQINFFEEFPDNTTLSKATLLKHRCFIFIAAKSLDEFLDVKEKLHAINPLIESAYWPLLSSSYWISPFSKTQELRDLYNDFKEHQQKNLKVLVDLELPLRNSRLFFINPLTFLKNKRIIESFLKDADKLGIKMFTSEFPAPLLILKLLGLSYSVKKYGHERIPMYYSSMVKREWSKRFYKKIVKKIPNIALGVTAKGILGYEQVITPKGLKEDLDYFNNKNIFIFRLGGLDKAYMDIIEKYID